MPVKSGYKMTEVGVIPEDWEVTRLSEIASIRTGPFGSSLHKSDYVVGGTPLINPTHIVDGKILPAAEVAVGAGTAKRLSEFSLLCNDIVIGRRGDIGRCAVVTETEAGWLCGTGSMIIRPTTQGTCSYIAIVVSSERAIKAISDSSVGSTMININQAGLGSLLLPCPPLPEQLAIAQTLSDVDALIESLSATLAKKRDIKHATMQQLLTGKTRLPGFEGEWKVRFLGDICSMKSGESITSDTLSDANQYPCFGGNGLRGFASRNTHDGFHVLIGRQGALCGNISLASGKFFASEHAIVATTSSGTAPTFLHFLLAKMNLNQYSESSAQPGLSVGKLLKLAVRLPDNFPEQLAIAQSLTDLDSELTALESRIAKTRELKLGMMQELLTGKTRLI